MEEKLYAKGVLEEEGKIIDVYYDQVPLDLEGVSYIDLEDKTLMPSFIDAHSHIAQVAMTLQTIDLSNCRNFSEIEKTLAAHVEENKSCLIGFGYDHNMLEEKKHPSKILLDKVSTTIPILITHKSGHMGVGNTSFLQLAKITKESENPVGGLIERDQDGNLTGYLEESAFMQASCCLPQPSQEEMIKAFSKAEQLYLSHGITTAQEGLTKEKDFQLLDMLAKQHQLHLDIVSYIDMKNSAHLVPEHPEYKEYHNHYRIGGYKLILDGSPQGKTAWLSKPYENEETYCGYPVYSDLTLKTYLERTVNEKEQVLVHCNGDAACEQMIKACQELEDIKKYRPIMIHAQTVRKDQLERMVPLGIIPSFFVAHVYYWGDVHIQNLKERAYKISPSHTALELGLPFTFHQDTPVLPPDMFRTIWCSVKRRTMSNVSLGEEERISVIDALKAVTIHAAYSYFEEDQKGSILPGKRTDFIILDKNPLEVEIDRLLDIQIVKTILSGKVVFTN